MTASQAIKFGCNYIRTEGVQAILSKIILHLVLLNRVESIFLNFHLNAL